MSDLDREAQEIYESMQRAAQDDALPEEIKRGLRAIFFTDIPVPMAGVKRERPRSRREAIGSIVRLMKRRREFMAANGLESDDEDSTTSNGASQPAGVSGDAPRAADGGSTSRPAGVSGGAPRAADACRGYSNGTRRRRTHRRGVGASRRRRIQHKRPKED